MATIEAGMWVWMPDDEEAYIATKVTANFKPGEEAKVEDADGNEFTIPAKKTGAIQQLDPECLEPTDNLVKLNDLNEALILHNLKLRFKKDVIYTYVSSILIAVNPFRMLPIYTPEVLDSYKEGVVRDMPPHIFAIADNAYKSMLDDVLDQAVVISGESGAGKTETMKLVLQYLAEVSGRAVVRKEGDSQSEGLEQQILKANPVMEAFGNAKTLRNNNSSRFGKWTEVVFSRAGAIVGGSIINYLLEKSRLPYQAEGERNYHAFYQLLEGANARPELKAALKLKDAEDYHYLNQSGVTTVENINDEQDFEELDNAMDVLGMTQEEKSTIFRLVAAILNLGNIEFAVDKSASSEDGSKVKEGEWLGLAATQLQVDEAALAKCLTYKNIGTRSIIFVPYSKEQAGEARDAMCKTMYGKLFDWLIQKINVSLSRGIGSGTTGETNVIGVLDIFGFESFDTNSFEQLCINFCNEKLQFHFNEHIFRLEQEEYASEGINVDNIEFADNQPCLDLLEVKGTGVFAMIDEEITVPKGSDDGFLRKVLKAHKDHPNMRKPKPKEKDARKVFIIKHYAGEVPYNSTGFLEKNKDQLHGDMTDVINSSSDPFVAHLLRPAESKKEEEAPKKKKRERARKKPGKRSDTLGTQFKKQLSQLMKTLAKTAPHFVRCMKPNHVKKGKIFESPMMLDQLRYAGLLEVCRIRQIGYPVRKTFDDFHFRYRCLGISASNHTELLEHLQSTGLIKAGQWAVGTSKVFMRNQTQQDLEAAREEALTDVVIRVQRQVRRYNQRARFLRFLEIIVGLKHAVQARSLERLEHWLNMVAELPYGGTSLSTVKAARELKSRLDEENRVRALLKEAIASRELASVVSALAAADALGFDCPEAAQARELQARIEMERKVLAELRAATKARDKDAMTALLDKCDELGIEDADEIKQAMALKQRLEEEEEALEELKAAIAQEHLQMLSACLTRMAEMGLEPPEVAVATALRDKLQAQGQARQQLKAAVAARSLTELTSALRKASETGLAGDTDEVVAAKELVERINAENAALAALDEAADAADAAAINAAIAGATSLGIDEHLAPFAKARQVLKRLGEEKAAVEALRAALASNTADLLNAAISTASQMGLDTPELGQARAAVAKLGAQNESLAALNAALDTNDLAKVRAAIAHAEEMGMGDAGAVADAKRVADRLEEEGLAAAELTTLTAGDDLAALNKALANATRLNLAKRHGAVVDAAKAQSSKLQALVDARAAITSAIKSNDLAGVTEALDAAAALGLTGPEMEAGTAAKAKLTEHKEITDALAAALDAKDKEALTALIERAVAADLDNDKVRSARIIADREKFVVETRLLMEEAVKANDLDKLNVALEKAIELGMEGEDIEAAKVKQEELERDRELAATLVAAVKSAGLKAGGTNPVTVEDAAPLKEAIVQAKADGLAEESPSLKQAHDMVARLEGLVALQGEIATGIAEGTLRQLRELLEKADDLDANLDVIGDVRRRIRELERERAAAVAAGDEPDFDDDEDEEYDDADEEERRRARQEKLDKARQPKFTWIKFSRIRDPDDFAKGTMFGKKKVKANQLRWQSGVIKKSITEIQGRKLIKMATRIHKDLLGYAGDKSMSFPATLAQDILEKGSQNPELVDEIYVQVMKHLTENPRPESARAGWQVLCMAVGAFPPSTELENYVLNFILQQVEGAGAVGRYARYALRRLEGIMDSGASGYVPNVEDIQAFKERPPILATIELVDGTPLTEDLPITPDLNVGKVLDICGHFMELQDPRQQYFGIFVQDLEPEDSEVSLDPSVPTKPDGTLKTTPRPLQNDSFMGDVVVAKSRLGIDFKFVYKRKVFLRNFDEESEDVMYERLIYLQAADEVILGNIPVDDEETVAKLVCDSMIVDLEAEMPEDPETLLECSMIEYIPVPWRDKYTEEEWAEKVLKYRGDLIDASPEDLQGMYVDEVKDSPLYGTHFFYVRQHKFPPHIAEGLDEELVIAFNSEGLHFLTLNREIVKSYGYADIYRWGGSSSQFSIIIWNADTQDTDDVSMHTSQAADMAALILDYINAIMAAS